MPFGYAYSDFFNNILKTRKICVSVDIDYLSGLLAMMMSASDVSQ